MENAESALNHRFEYGGFGPVELGDEIDWINDPYVASSKGKNRRWHPDLRIIWELNRCSQLPVLGLAYNMTGDDRFVAEIMSQTEKWIESNPPWSGANWESSMEVSIRIINWTWTFYLIRNAEQFDDSYVTKFLTQVSAHGTFIYRNLERSAVSNNHYLAGGIGLLHLGILFPELKESRRWLRTGRRVTFSEILNQTNPDGAGFEGSIPYHGLVLELVLPTIALCLQNGVDVPERVISRIGCMLDFVVAYSRSDGTYPHFGDRDDGHLLRVARRAPDSHKYLLAVGAVLFQRADFKAGSNGWDLEAELLFGDKGRQLFDSLPPSVQNKNSRPFLESGYFFMQHEHAHMAIDCADVGLKGRGGHGHNDCLSFELHAYDRSLLVDSGSFQYSVPEKTRRMIQGTSSHNTAMIDDQEIARFTPGNIWGISGEANPTLRFWHSDDNYDVFEGSHDGYLRLNDPVTHTRRIIFDKKSLFWVIVDSFSGAAKHVFKIYFHLVPEYCGLVTELVDDQGIRTNDPIGANLALLPISRGAFDVSIVDSHVSRRYGESERAPVVCYAAKEICPWSFEICVYPFEASNQPPPVESLKERASAVSRYWNTKRSSEVQELSDRE